MVTQHAAGPWKVEGCALKDVDGDIIASGAHNNVVTGNVLQLSLQLAAAAPEMRLALIEAAVMFESLGKWSTAADEMAKRCRAIAQAGGPIRALI